MLKNTINKLRWNPKKSASNPQKDKKREQGMGTKADKQKIDNKLVGLRSKILIITLN